MAVDGLIGGGHISGALTTESSFISDPCAGNADLTMDTKEYGMTQTLVDGLAAAAAIDHKGYTFLDDRLEGEEWSFARISAEADRRARYFRSLGLEKGDRLAMIVPDGEDFVLSFFGAVRAGIVPVPMYPPLALGKLDSYIDTAARILGTASAKMLLTTKQVSPILWSLLSRVETLEEIVLTEKVRDHDDSTITATLDDIVIEPSDACFLQFTSGSTSDPKGVIVSHENLVANANAIMYDGLDCDPETDRGVSWLPLYHDMGLIGFVISPLIAHVPVVFIPTLSFVKRPPVWLDVVNEYRGTITFAPNFAFGLATKRATPQKLAQLDLSCIRVLGCGAEPINPTTMRAFVDKFATAGFSPNALMPCYGMAEATLAMSFDRLDRPMNTLTIDRDAYEGDKVAKEAAEGLELVGCGATFPNHDVAIMGAKGELLEDGQVGEIVFRGPSVTRGYFENADATKDLLAGGWLHTGDLGFKKNGTLYISGRQKDLVILNGRNYYPQSIEWEVEQIDGIRKGNVVAFSTPGDSSEELVVVAETKVAEKDLLEAAVKRRVHDAFGIRPREIVLVGPGGLPKTSSGKLQRRKTKQLFEEGTLGTENRLMGSTATRVALARHLTRSAFARFTHNIKKTARPAKKLVDVVRRAESR